MKGLCRSRIFIVGFLVVILGFYSPFVIAQEYPTKQIEFIINFGPGGTSDLSARALAEATSKYLGQPVVPVNKPGGAGTIGVTYVKNAKPDGYTIGLITTSPAFILPHVQEVPYDMLRDFTPIVNYGEYLFNFMVRSDSPWKTFKEMIDFARQHPGEVKVGIAGSRVTNVNGIALSRVAAKENLKFTFIPYKSGAEILTALLGGHIDLYGSSVDPAAKDYISMGKVRILAFISDRKLPGFENVPTLQELYGVSIPNILGVIGPKGMSPHVKIKLEDALTKAIREPAFEDLMRKMDCVVTYMNSKELGEYIEKVYKEQKEVIEALKAEEAKK